ncbi:MAG: Rrf2 family transcriptional regulator [candidate division Zixibacteria bacterium]|nr:Rrf2 family transcriptional regulator [candidate division Zixibacteria bacterium]
MINNRTEYAIRALWQLSEAKDYFSTSEAIAHAQDIPGKFLPQILSDLSRAGLVRSVRGYGGGVRLARPPEKIKLLEILEAIQGTVFLYDCIKGPIDCQHEPDCKLQKVYKKAQDAMKAEFAKVALSDLKSKKKK